MTQKKHGFLSRTLVIGSLGLAVPALVTAYVGLTRAGAPPPSNPRPRAIVAAQAAPAAPTSKATFPRPHESWAPRPRSPYFRDALPLPFPLPPPPPDPVPAQDPPPMPSFSDELTSDEEVVVIETNDVVPNFMSSEPSPPNIDAGTTRIYVDPSPPLNYGM